MKEHVTPCFNEYRGGELVESIRVPMDQEADPANDDLNGLITLVEKELGTLPEGTIELGHTGYPAVGDVEKLGNVFKGKDEYSHMGYPDCALYYFYIDCTHNKQSITVLKNSNFPTPSRFHKLIDEAD